MSNSQPVIVKRIVHNALTELGFTEDFRRAIENLGETSDQELIGRVRRIDRGWSTFLCVPRAEVAAATSLAEKRVRNLGADVAVGDWIIVSGQLGIVDGKIVEGGGPLIPRLYFHDDTKGATGKIHVGFIGPHRYVENASTN